MIPEHKFRMNTLKLITGVYPDMLSDRATCPFSEISIDFVSTLSSLLLKNRKAREYSDIIAFAFWCRKAHLISLKSKHAERTKTSIGRGICLHFTPSNVPSNFAYSFIFGVLAGSSNAVKLSSNSFPQIDIICQAIEDLLCQPKFTNFREKVSIFRYENSDVETTKKLCLMALSRIIWGGDDTINFIKSFETHPRCVDVCFSDRYSLCALNANSVLNLSDSEMNILLNNFYNDTLVMDQLACSSPHLVLWHGSSNEIISAKDIFWSRFEKLVESKHTFHESAQNDKFKLACDFCISTEATLASPLFSKITRIEVESIDESLIFKQGKSGFFLESNFNQIADIELLDHPSIQTLTYFGFDNDNFFSEILSSQFCGLDRIVPVGQALEISLTWDGYDIIGMLTRSISFK